MYYVWLAIFWTIGTILSSFLLIPPLIILFFGIPFTIELRRKGIITTLVPVYKYLVSLILLSGLFLLATWAIWNYFPQYFWAYAVGVLIILFSGIGKCGRNKDNIEDYLTNNAEFIDQEKFQRIFAG